MTIVDIETNEFTMASVRDVVGRKLFSPLCSDGPQKLLIEYLAEFKGRNVSIDEIIYSDLNENGAEAFVTLQKPDDSALLNDMDGEVVHLVELLVEGTGIARSYENVRELFYVLEKNGVNILGQICTDLKIRLYVSCDDKEKILISLLGLNIHLDHQID